MTDQVRNEELHVWRIRIQNGMFDPADLCEFAVRLMDALESAEVDLARVKDVGIEAVRRAEQTEARAAIRKAEGE